MAMAVRVRIPSSLRKITDGAAEVQASGTTVAEVVGSLADAYPALKTRLLDESGQVKRFVNIYVGGEDIRFLAGMQTAVADGADVSIVPAVAGG
jgi:MoaD family protein